MNVCTSSEMLAILSFAKNACFDIVHKWRLGSTFFPSNFKLGHRFHALLKVCSDRYDIVPLCSNYKIFKKGPVLHH